MDWKDYFKEVRGLGVLATADGEGNVDAAVYSRPHLMEDGRLGFIMRDRLTHHNLQSNPRATYLFREDGKGYRGRRLFLEKRDETEDQETIEALGRRSYLPGEEPTEKRFLVTFDVLKEIALIGPGEPK